jgi:hypothetical protein
MAESAKEIHGGIEMVQEERVDDDWNVSFLPALNPMGLGGSMATPILFYFLLKKIYFLIF